MSYRARRQVPPTLTGATTVAPVVVPSGSLGIDSSETGSIPGASSLLSAVTVTSSKSSSSTSSTATATAAADANHSTSSGISTPAIVGIIVAIFVCLAVALVIFMFVRNKKRMQARRARAKSRKSWSRINEEPGAGQMQMRATNTASVADPNVRTGDESFLSLNSTHALIVQNQAVQQPTQLPTTQQPAPPSRNPFLQLQHQAASATPAPARAPVVTPTTAPMPTSPPSRSTDDSHIPNPFASPPRSPSHSPTPSHTSTYESSYAPAAFLAMPPSSLERSSSSSSDYPYEFPPAAESREEMSGTELPPKPKPARLVRKASAAKQSRERELRAMQDLISALDARQNKTEEVPPPSSFHELRVDTQAAARGTSRLSMGEGLVTPGGHSIRDPSIRQSDASWGNDGEPYWPPGEHSIGHENFPLPPASVFKAALNIGNGAQADKGKARAP